MKILDLFCGGGGAALGIHQALEEKGIKHNIYGIDIKKCKKYYPFNFIQDDVFNISWTSYDFIWSSPPCQQYSISTKYLRNKGKKYPDLIKQTRKQLIKTGKPYCIENVIGSPLKSNLWLCGLMFNIPLYRHRLFESNFVIYPPLHPKHNNQQKIKCIAGHSRFKGEVKLRCNIMGTHYMPDSFITQAVPPVYSKYIMLEFLKKRKGILDYV